MSLPIERVTDLMQQVVANNNTLIAMAKKIKDPKERLEYLIKILKICSTSPSS